MLTESLDEERADAKAAFYNFRDRVESIKRDNEKERVWNLLERCICSGRGKEAELDVKKMTAEGIRANHKKETEATRLKSYQCLQELEVVSLEEKAEELWGDYLMNILMYQKYLLKSKGEANEKNQK